MKKVLVILALALMISSFCVGKLDAEGFWIDQYAENVTSTQVLQIMYQARHSHQFLIDHPHLINGGQAGDLQHHENCVERYNIVIHYILNGME